MTDNFPTAALISLAPVRDLMIGLGATQIALRLPGLFMAAVPLAIGRTTSLHGGMHLVISGALFMLSAVP